MIVEFTDEAHRDLEQIADYIAKDNPRRALSCVKELRVKIARLPYVTYEAFEYVFFRWFEAMGLVLPQPWDRRDHFEELEEALESVASERGWSVVPLDAALGHAYASRLQMHRLHDNHCSNVIYLVGSTRELEGRDALLLRDAVRAG